MTRRDAEDNGMTAEAHRALLKTAADHWSATPNTGKTRWWTNRHILQHINRLVCGIPLDGFCAGLNKEIRKRLKPQARGLSVGCGNGFKEIELVKQGIVQEFDLFEISEARVMQGRKRAADVGVGERVRFNVNNAFVASLRSDYDLVYWNNALHHMLNVHSAVAWSRLRLRQGGLFAMDDFVGPTRFQWSDRNLRFASAARSLLPSRLLVNPANQATMLPARVVRPNPEALAAADPTEAADSGNILSAVKSVFPNAEIVLTGGAIYHLALNDVLSNVLDNDLPLLQSLLLVDEALADQGETHYAVVFAEAP